MLRPAALRGAAKHVSQSCEATLTCQKHSSIRCLHTESTTADSANDDGQIQTEQAHFKVGGAQNDVIPQWKRLGVKDNIVTKEYSTTAASGILQRYKSPFEATVLERFREKRGFEVFKKTNMDEFGMGSHSTNSFLGTVHNVSPYEQYSAGGSSGGSAIAVANGECNIALGTDTGGSVRLPAAYTGIIGYKPSYGMISRWGVIPYANSLDTVGILSSSMDLLMKLPGIYFHDPKDPTSLTEASRSRLKQRRKAAVNTSLIRPLISSLRMPDKPIKIGVPVEYNLLELDPDVRGVWQSVLENLQREGCVIVPVSLPNTKHALSAYYVIAAAEAASNLSKYDGIRYGTRSSKSDGVGDVLYSATRGQLFGDETKRRILLGSYTLSSAAIDNYFIKAQKVRRLVQRDFDRVFRIPNPLRPPDQFDLSELDESITLDDKLGPSQVDFILCPTAPTLAPTLESISKQSPVDSYMNDVFTVPASLAGIPAISIPAQVPSSNGAPPFAGIQILAQFSDDARLLQIARLTMAVLKKNEMNISEPLKIKKYKHVKNRKTQGVHARESKFRNVRKTQTLRIRTHELGLVRKVHAGPLVNHEAMTETTLPFETPGLPIADKTIVDGSDLSIRRIIDPGVITKYTSKRDLSDTYPTGAAREYNRPLVRKSSWSTEEHKRRGAQRDLNRTLYEWEALGQERESEGNEPVTDSKATNTTEWNEKKTKSTSQLVLRPVRRWAKGLFGF